MTIDINCDMGEAYSIYSCGDDEGIMPFITSANVACGFHASDPVVMHRTVKLAKAHGVKVGAHPSFPDRDGFGRRVMKMDREELRDAVIYQVAALKGFLDIEGMTLNHIKPHGALYGAAWTDEDVAIACAEAAQAFGVPMYGTTGTLHERSGPGTRRSSGRSRGPRLRRRRPLHHHAPPHPGGTGQPSSRSCGGEARCHPLGQRQGRADPCRHHLCAFGYTRRGRRGQSGARGRGAVPGKMTER